MKELSHHIRNAILNIEGLFHHLDKATELEVMKQLQRIEQALIIYELRIEKEPDKDRKTD